MRPIALMVAWGLLGALWGQDVPVRDDPLQDLGAYLTANPLTLNNVPQSQREWQQILRNAPDSAIRTIALWKLHQAERLPKVQGKLFAQFTGYLFPNTNWETPAKATYHVSGVWVLGEQALLECVWSDAPRREPPMGLGLPEPVPERFDTMPLARLTFRTGAWEWQFGRAFLRWTGGYSGSLIVNDTTPPIAYGKVAFPVRLPLLGSWQCEQFLAQFRQSGRTVWWGGRRFERNLGRRWRLSLAEAFKALDLPDGILSQVAPYYAYQKWMSTAERGSGWFNYLAEVGLQYHLGDQNRIYVFWLTDDMRAPDFWGGRGADTPRKTALLVGTRLNLNPQTRIIWEMVRTDGTRNGGVYGDSGHDRRYAYNIEGFPMGHPFGANQVGFYGRLDYAHQRWLVSVEGYNLRRFHPQYSGERGYELIATIAYQPNPAQLLSMRYRTRHLRNTTLEADARCGWWLEWQQRF